MKHAGCILNLDIVNDYIPRNTDQWNGPSDSEEINRF